MCLGESNTETHRDKQTERHGFQNQNDATKIFPKGKSESRPLKHHNHPVETALAVQRRVGEELGRDCGISANRDR